MDYIKRPDYLSTLRKWKDHHIIKVLTGVRRAGKSTLLSLFRSELLKDGVDEKQIVAVNFEDADFGRIQTSDDLWEYMRPRLANGRTTYVFLDEIQRVKDFEKAVDGLFVKPDVDIYVTGSNAFLLSGEIATYLSGRYVTVPVYPLSFREYCEGLGLCDSPERAWMNYLRFGSFPQVVSLGNDPELVSSFNEGNYHTILQKDVLSRCRTDATSMFERIVAFMFDNIGNVSSVRSIAGTLAADGMKIAPNTIDEYLNRLCEAYLLHKVKAIDVQGREHLKTGCKYYVADIGIRNYLLGSRQFDRGHILENVVYLELLRRHGEVFIGRNGTKEIDFIARDAGDVTYYQVAETLAGDEVREREFNALRTVRDHHPKMILTLDPVPPSNDGGIRTVNALDFLLGKCD